MAIAKVYVFNILGEPIRAFAPNGFTAGQIALWSGPDTEAPYTPAQLIVPLVDANTDESLKYGRFAYGKNHVLFRTGSTYTFNIDIPEPKTSREKDDENGEEESPYDLLLYIARGTWVLYHAGGKLKSKMIRQGKVCKESSSSNEEGGEQEAE